MPTLARYPSLNGVLLLYVIFALRRFSGSTTKIALRFLNMSLVFDNVYRRRNDEPNDVFDSENLTFKCKTNHNWKVAYAKITYMYVSRKAEIFTNQCTTPTLFSNLSLQFSRYQWSLKCYDRRRINTLEIIAAYTKTFQIEFNFYWLLLSRTRYN